VVGWRQAARPGSSGSAGFALTPLTTQSAGILDIQGRHLRFVLGWVSPLDRISGLCVAGMARLLRLPGRPRLPASNRNKRIISGNRA